MIIYYNNMQEEASLPCCWLVMVSGDKLLIKYHFVQLETHLYIKIRQCKNNTKLILNTFTLRLGSNIELHML